MEIERMKEKIESLVNNAEHLDPAARRIISRALNSLDEEQMEQFFNYIRTLVQVLRPVSKPGGFDQVAQQLVAAARLSGVPLLFDEFLDLT